MQIVAANLRRFRDDAGISQDQAARRFGGKLTGQQLARWERGDTWIGAAELKLLMDVYKRPMDHAFMQNPPWSAARSDGGSARKPS